MSTITEQIADVRPFLVRSTATADGAADGSTIIDSSLGEPDGFWEDCWIRIKTGASQTELRRVSNWDLGTTTLTVSPSFSNQITSGIEYRMSAVLKTEDTGLNTNPEKYRQDHQWNPDAEVTITAAGAGGEQNFGAAVAAGEKRRVQELTARHCGTNNTVVSLLDESGGNVIISFDVPAEMTNEWSSQPGRSIPAGLQPVIQSSDVTGGNTIVSAGGLEDEVS